MTPTEEEPINELNGNGNGELLLKRNIVNICFNTNDNFMDAELSGTQEQLPPTDDLAVANEFSDNLSILLGDGDGAFTQAAESPVTVGDRPASVAVDTLSDIALEINTHNILN